MLYITDHFTYYPLPYVNQQTLVEHLKTLPNYQEVNVGKIGDIPLSTLNKRLLVGGITNPWVWYTNFYRHTPTHILRCLGGQDLSFKSILNILTNPLEDPFCFKELMSPQDFDSFLCSGMGFWSWSIKRVYYELPEFLICIDKPVNSVSELLCTECDKREFVYNYTETYDQEMCDWIQMADGSLMLTFDYNFNGPNSCLVYDTTKLEFPPSFSLIHPQ